MRNYAGTALLLAVTMTAAIGSYTVNLKVSGERAAVERLRRSLAADAKAMRGLQAELRTRARLPEMQRWNDSVFQMSAPSPAQFLRSPVQLASFVPAAPGGEPPLRYTVTAPVATAAPAPVVRAAYAAPAVPRPAGPAITPAAAPARLVRASYVPSAPALAGDMAASIGASLDEVRSGPRDLLPPGGQ